MTYGSPTNKRLTGSEAVGVYHNKRRELESAQVLRTKIIAQLAIARAQEENQSPYLETRLREAQPPTSDPRAVMTNYELSLIPEIEAEIHMIGELRG